MNSSKRTNNINILVVDDEIEILEFIKMFLESLHWQVDTASSIEEAFSYLHAAPYFLVLSDIAMPDLDGYEFVNKLREEHITSEIALMTGFGYNPNHTLVRIRRSMRCPFFFKPLDRIKLAAGVQSAWNDYHLKLCDKYPSS
jgi:DNA-binding NtrC family response regulator